MDEDKDRKEMLKAFEFYYRFELGTAIIGMILSGLGVIAYVVVIIRAIITH